MQQPRIAAHRAFSRIPLAGLLAFLCCALGASSLVGAHSSGEPKDSPLPVVSFTEKPGLGLQEDRSIEEDVIDGPPKPPPGLQRPVISTSDLASSSSAVFLDVPTYEWSFGCSATSAAMIAAFFDRDDYPNIYTGPTNGGVMPLFTSSWPMWEGTPGDPKAPFAQNPLVASRNGLDGRITRGSIDDYWVASESSAPDPYINHWAEHTWGDALGDYMKTSQSAFGNKDGATRFYFYSYSPDPLSCDAITAAGNSNDGTVGRKLFYEARGYFVTDCYSQKTDNNGGDFTFARYKAEIDAGQPVLINLDNHTVVGTGYDLASNTIYIHDTWDTSTHSMNWGNGYPYTAMQYVSIVHLAPPSPSVPSGIIASDGASTTQVTVNWNASIATTYYQIWRNTVNSLSGAINLGDSNITVYVDETAIPGALSWYFVKACNAYGCSGFSSSDSGYPALSPPDWVDASDGAYPDKIQIGWNPSIGATSYQVYRNTISSSSGAILLGAASISPFDDITAAQDTTYWYFVKACTSTGCSAFGSFESGYRLSPPVGIDVSKAAFTDQVRILWTVSRGATYYQVYRNISTSSTGADLLSSPTDSSFSDTTGSVGTTYWYFVNACNANGCSNFSNSDFGLWVTTLVIPPVPTGLSASDQTLPDRVRIAWDDAYGAAFYEVYRNTSNSADGATLLGSPQIPPFNDKTAVRGTIYWYFVKACNTTGCSDTSISDGGSWYAWQNYLPLISQ